MNGLARTLRSSIGRKFVVAITGVALLGFVLVHMLGNLQLFLGPEVLNAYAAQLKSLGGLLWVARGGLAAMFLLHVVFALRLAAENRAARPQRYVHGGRVQSSAGARTMVATGLMVLLFVLYHLAHFTLGLTHPTHFGHVQMVAGPRGPETRHDVYSMVVLGFQQPLVAGLYIAAMALLALHLSHGVQSVVQTLGVQSAQGVKRTRRLSLALAWVVFLGNTSMPIAVLAGLVPLPGA